MSSSLIVHHPSAYRLNLKDPNKYKILNPVLKEKRSVFVSHDSSDGLTNIIDRDVNSIKKFEASCKTRQQNVTQKTVETKPSSSLPGSFNQYIHQTFRGSDDVQAGSCGDINREVRIKNKPGQNIKRQNLLLARFNLERNQRSTTCSPFKTKMIDKYSLHKTVNHNAQGSPNPRTHTQTMTSFKNTFKNSENIVVFTGANSSQLVPSQKQAIPVNVSWTNLIW